ncbi:Tubulin-specific chaperone A [Halotydeus destructor]|nr:Tubulin-specific chaperone A [Halotydeus destructor]
MSDPRVRQLKIKTGVLKRAVKEKQVYEKELERELLRLTQMEAANKDVHDLQYQKKVIEESKMMIPDCRKRICNAYNDLKILLGETAADLAENEDYVAANSLLIEAGAM